MRAVSLGLLLLSISASHAHAYGAIAAGDAEGAITFTFAYNQKTYDAANSISLKQCREQGLSNCAIKWNFKNICISVGRAGSNGEVEGHGDIPNAAREQMDINCRSAGERSCSEAVQACDTAILIDGIEEDTAASIPEVTIPRTIVQQLAPYLVIPGALDFLAGLIVVALLIWIFISIVSTTPLLVLKERVVISAWISGPAVLEFVLWLTATNFESPFKLAVHSLSLWTYTFTALIIGGRLRQRLAPSWKPPSALSLPLATLVFTITACILLWLFYLYVIFPHFVGCVFVPKDPANPCWRMATENVSAGLVTLVALVACGVVLPAESNLVLANNRLGASIRQSLANFRRKRRERQEKAKQALIQSQEAASYPVPTLYTPTASDVMRLKLKRSQRSSLFGKVVFVLDARMELTREELDLVRTYRLGKDVVYESGDRERRKEATLGYLEMTKGGPGLRDSPGSQLWGVAKSFFWMGRAGISATAAAFSLQVTIDGLMSGVHVECKSMGELLEAERAIRDAAQNLRAYIDVARTFDGREEIVEL